MRRALISTLLFFIINDGLTQVHNPSDALNLIKKIDGANKSFKVYKTTFNYYDSICQQKPLLFCNFFVDSSNGQLQKTVVSDIASNSFQTYYFERDKLICVRVSPTNSRSISSTFFFTDMDFSLGTTYKDYFNDKVLLERQKLLVDAYLILLHYKALRMNENN